MPKVIAEQRILDGTIAGVVIAHVQGDGSDHSFIDQDVTTTGDPTFNSVTVSTSISAPNLEADTINEATLNAGVTVEGVLLKDSEVNVTGVTESTSSSTGALIVDGGAGVAGNIYAGGTVSAVNDTAPTGSRIDLTIESNLPRIILEKGNGSGGSLRRWDTIINSSNGLTIRDQTIGADRMLIDTSGIASLTGSLQVDTINEYSFTAGVTIEDTLIKDNTFQVDSISERVVGNGVSIEGVLLKDSDVLTDQIIELTLNAGVTIEEVLLKDGNATFINGATIQVNTINETTTGAGVTIEGVLLKDNDIVISAGDFLSTDTIIETTAAAGVTVDGVLLKDGGAVFADGASIEVDAINEATLDAGVTIEGVLLKDSDITISAGNALSTDTISETTATAGVTIDGVLLKDGGAVFADGASVEVDTINEATAAAGVTIDGVLVKDGGAVFADGASIEVDTINEATTGVGVTVDGVLLKDGGAVFADGASVEIDTINEATLDAGVTIEGVLLKDSDITISAGNALSTDTISETTAAAGVTVDGVLLKDGGAVFADGASVEVDTINEATTGVGVTIDGVLLKDGGAVFADGATVEVDTINEATATAGVTIDGVLVKDGGAVFADGATVEVDTINEATLNAGVTIEGVLIKDGAITLPGLSAVSESDTAADGAAVTLQRARVGPAAAANADELGEILFQGYTALPGYESGAAIRAIVDGTPGSGDLPTRLSFYTAPDGSATPVENFYILPDGNVNVVNTLAVDTISEFTSTAGVTIDGVLLKDGGAVFADGATVEVDTINEATAAAGVTIDGVLVKDGGAVFADGASIEVDTINEATTGAGVTIDGVLLKDGAPVLSTLDLALESDTVSDSGSLLLSRARAGPAATANNDELGEILFQGYTALPGYQAGAAIRAFVDGTPGSGDLPTRMVFSTSADGSVVPTTRMTIDSSGDIQLTSTTVAFTNGSQAALYSAGGIYAAGRLVAGNGGGGLYTDLITQGLGGAGVTFNSDIFMETGTTFTISRVNDGPDIDLRRYNTGLTTVADNNNLGNINFYGYDGNSYEVSAAITSFVDGTVADGIVPGELLLQTANSSGSLTTRMSINASGIVDVADTLNVSTITSTAALFLNPTTGATILGSASATTQRAQITKTSIGFYEGTSALANNTLMGQVGFFGHDGTDVATISAAVIGRVDGTVASNIVPGELEFHTADSAGTLTKRMTIDATGLTTMNYNLLMATGANISKSAAETFTIQTTSATAGADLILNAGSSANTNSSIELRTEDVVKFTIDPDGGGFSRMRGSSATGSYTAFESVNTLRLISGGVGDLQFYTDATGTGNDSGTIRWSIDQSDSGAWRGEGGLGKITTTTGNLELVPASGIISLGGVSTTNRLSATNTGLNFYLGSSTVYTSIQRANGTVPGTDSSSDDLYFSAAGGFYFDSDTNANTIAGNLAHPFELYYQGGLIMRVESDSTLHVDTIEEVTASNGVTVNTINFGASNIITSTGDLLLNPSTDVVKIGASTTGAATRTQINLDSVQFITSTASIEASLGRGAALWTYDSAGGSEHFFIQARRGIHLNCSISGTTDINDLLFGVYGSSATTETFGVKANGCVQLYSTTTDPTTPTPTSGQVYYNSTDNELKAYTGAAFESIPFYSYSTYSPDVQGGTGSYTGSFTKLGHYTLVGNACTVQIHIAWTAGTVTKNSGDMRITLPFTSKNSTNRVQSLAIGRIESIRWSTSTTVDYQLGAYIDPNTSYLYIYASAINAAGAPGITTDASFLQGFNGIIDIGGTYIIE